MPTFDLDECAAYLKVDKTTVQALASSGQLPGAKIGRAWVFLVDEVEQYLRNETRMQTLARQSLGQPSELHSAVNNSQVLTPLRRLPPRRRSLPVLPDMPN